MKYAIQLLSLSLLLLLGCMSPVYARLCKAPRSEQEPVGVPYFIYENKDIADFRMYTSDPNSKRLYEVIGALTFRNMQAVNSRYAIGSSSLTFICNGASSARIVGIGDPIFGNIYRTSMPGIGVRIKIDEYDIPYNVLNIAISMIGEKPSVKASFFLIKIGDIPYVGIPSGPFAYKFVDDEIYFEYRFSAASTPIEPKIPTCTVDSQSRNLNVNLGSHSINRFNRIGATTPAVPFSIVLSCMGGDAGTTINAYVTLTDTANPSNTSTTLSLNSSSEVAGLGVQILKNGTPLGFGPESFKVGSTNQWFAGSIRQGQSTLNIPLEARYIQTWNNVYGGGRANANATFTVSYE